jgi:hopanoid biosynthesis associated RND transporter like protein HpnN
MIIAFLSTFTLLPALLDLLRLPPETSPPGFPAAIGLERLLVRRRRAIFVTFAVACIGCLLLLPQLRFDFNPLNLRSPKVESIATLLDLMRDPDTTTNTVDVLADDLHAANDVAARLAALPEVRQALTLSSFVPEEQTPKLALIADASMLLDATLNPVEVMPPPSEQEKLQAMARCAQALRNAAGNQQTEAAGNARRLAELLHAFNNGDAALRARMESVLLPGLRSTLTQLRAAFQAEPVTIETLPEQLVHEWVAADGRARVEVFPSGDSNNNETLRRFVSAVRQIVPEATGAPVSILETSRTVLQAFRQAALWAFCSVALLLIAVLRRPTHVLLTVAPVMLAALLTLGVCAAAHEPLNFANIIALPLLFGIGVAFTIYFVMAWRAGAASLLDSSLTRAILFSALTTGTAFGSLWMSAHPGTASLGRLLALSLAFTLACTLFLLPALLKVRRQ